MLHTTKWRRRLYIIFMIYLLILVKVILLKLPVPILFSRLKAIYHGTIPINIQGSNVAPLFTIKNYIHAIGKIDSTIILQNIGGNILLFIPLGILIPLLFTQLNTFYYLFLLGFGISFWFELVQLILGIGTFDVDDLLLNTIGTMIGYALCHIGVCIYCFMTNRHTNPN